MLAKVRSTDDYENISRQKLDIIFTTPSSTKSTPKIKSKPKIRSKKSITVPSPTPVLKNSCLFQYQL